MMVSSFVLSNDQTARVWNASSSQLLATLQGHTGSVNSAVFSPDGQLSLPETPFVQVERCRNLFESQR